MIAEHIHDDARRAADMAALDIRETPGVSGGYPCVGSTRIPVGVLVEDRRELGSFAALAATYTQLTLEQIRDALAFYERHPERVDEDIARNARAWHALTAP